MSSEEWDDEEPGERGDWRVSLYERHRARHDLIEDDTEIAVGPSSIQRELTCHLCLGIIRNTLASKLCLHRFCRECVLRQINQNRGFVCPLCRTRFNSLNNFKPDRNFDGLIGKLIPADLSARPLPIDQPLDRRRSLAKERAVLVRRDEMRQRRPRRQARRGMRRSTGEHEQLISPDSTTGSPSTSEPSTSGAASTSRSEPTLDSPPTSSSSSSPSSSTSSDTRDNHNTGLNRSFEVSSTTDFESSSAHRARHGGNDSLLDDVDDNSSDTLSSNHQQPSSSVVCAEDLVDVPIRFPLIRLTDFRRLREADANLRDRQSNGEEQENGHCSDQNSRYPESVPIDYLPESPGHDVETQEVGLSHGPPHSPYGENRPTDEIRVKGAAGPSLSISHQLEEYVPPGDTRPTVTKVEDRFEVILRPHPEDLPPHHPYIIFYGEAAIKTITLPKTTKVAQLNTILEKPLDIQGNVLLEPRPEWLQVYVSPAIHRFIRVGAVEELGEIYADYHSVFNGRLELYYAWEV